MNRLLATRQYELLAGNPQMFMVGSNGDNFRGESLHRRLGSGLPNTAKSEYLVAKQAQVEKDVRSYNWSTTDVDVCGKDGQALRVEGVQQWPDWLAPVTLEPEDWRLGLPTRELQQRIQEAAKPAVEGKLPIPVPTPASPAE